LLDLLGAFEIFIFDAAIERALVALGFAAAQMGFADMRSHQFATGGHLESLGGRFVGFDLWHETYSISDFKFQIFDFRSSTGLGAQSEINNLKSAINGRG
jgi:hypothetical protein